MAKNKAVDEETVGKSGEQEANYGATMTDPGITTTKATIRLVHCDACSKNYSLAEGETPTCCEKPNISNL